MPEINCNLPTTPNNKENQMKTFMFVVLSFLCSSLYADPVIFRIGMSSTGPINAMQEFLGNLATVATQLQPDSNNAATLIQNTMHGPNVGGVSVAITFDNLQGWTDYQAMTVTPEWQNAVQSFPAENFTIDFQSLSDVVWRDPNYTLAQGGEVLVINVLSVNQGGLAPLVAFLERASGVARQMGSQGQATLMSPIVAGDATAQTEATVVIKFPSFEAWAETTAMQNSSSEWAQLMAGFPAQEFSLSYQGLSTVVSIP